LAVISVWFFKLRSYSSRSEQGSCCAEKWYSNLAGNFALDTFNLLVEEILSHSKKQL